MRQRPRDTPCPLRAAAIATPDATAILSPNGKISYAELDRIVSATEIRLQEAGCEPGSRVALYLPRDERYVALLLALLRIGGVACPMSTRLPPEGTFSLLDKIACSTLITEDEELLRKTPPGVKALGPEALISEGENGQNPIYLPLGDPATVVFTSGSTGGPKAALHTFGNHYFSALGSNVNIPIYSDDRWLLSLPLYHVGGLSIVFRCLFAGAVIALPKPGVPLGESLTDLGVTHVSLVATQLQRLLEEGIELGTLKAALLGGGPTPAPVLEEAVGRGISVYTSYGLTEMASQVTATTSDAGPEDLLTSGKALPHREVSVSGRGEILVRGETLFAGYVEGDEVDEPLDAEGWFHTGDLGEFDERGNLRVLGRLDNLFISGGENIQPEEIEASLEGIEDVERATVVPVPDLEFGERPVAFLQMADERSLPENLAGKLEETLPRFKVPVAFYDWPEDADTEKMKPDRTFLHERALQLWQKRKEG